MLGNYPEYEKTCTRLWELLKKERNLELWEYFDNVDWKTRYAIKVDGEIRLSFSDSEISEYMAWKIALKLFGADDKSDLDG